MKNKEKYKTVKEQVAAFNKFCCGECEWCRRKTCASCPILDLIEGIFYSKYQCYSQWLELDEDRLNINIEIEDVTSANHFSVISRTDISYNES